MPLVIDVEAFRTRHRPLQPVDPVDEVEDDVDAEIAARPFADRIEKELAPAENAKADVAFTLHAAVPVNGCG